MGLKEYCGAGGNAGAAVSSLYRAAGSKQPDSDISYVVGIKEKSSGGDFVRGSSVNDYNEALNTALSAAGMDSYSPRKHQLTVEAKAQFEVSEEKPAVRAGGAAPRSVGCRRLTDLF